VTVQLGSTLVLASKKRYKSVAHSSYDLILTMCQFLQAKNTMCQCSKHINIGTFLQLQVICKYTRGWRTNQTQNSGGTSNHENIIYNFKVGMPSLNQVTTKCIWKNNCYIMTKLLPNKVRKSRFVLRAIPVQFLGPRSAVHGTCATC
jgi:hypothetical protein